LALALICCILIVRVARREAGTSKNSVISYSDLCNEVKQGLVKDATIQGNQLTGHLKATPMDQFHTTIPANHNDDLEKLMIDARVSFTIHVPPGNKLLPLVFNVR
jgi:ATP-dependent Zn protease